MANQQNQGTTAQKTLEKQIAKVVDHSAMKLGAVPSKPDPRTLKFGAYLNPAKLPPLPTSVEWGNGVKEWGMMDNDKISDCTAAAAAHLIMSYADDTGKVVVDTSADDDNGNLLLTIPKNAIYALAAILFAGITAFGLNKYFEGKKQKQ